jgi:chromosome partitioning protein
VVRIVVANQRGGVGKTVTTKTLGRFFAELGLKVLIIDTDPQGSIGSVLGLQPRHYLYHFVIHNYVFKDCVVAAHPYIDVLCSNRETQQTEAILMGSVAREMTFENLFSKVEDAYDVVLVDVAPSINLLQTCAMIYAKQLLIPVTMDPLSLQGAAATFETTRTLNELFRMDIRAVALLPTMVDQRFQMTQVITESLKGLSGRFGISLLHAIRTDSTVTKAIRAKKFLADYDPRCKAMEDYQVACGELLDLVRGHIDGRKLQVQAKA